MSVHERMDREIVRSAALVSAAARAFPVAPVFNRCSQRLGKTSGVLSALAALAMFAGGCTRESLRVALEAQQRADRVQQAVFERQHEGLRVFLYRDLVRKIDDAGEPLNDVQRSAINAAWNERDLIEFWAIQQERARALRLAGVDAKLYGDQSIVDLLAKSLAAKLDRVQQAVAAEAGKQVTK